MGHLGRASAVAACSGGGMLLSACAANVPRVGAGDGERWARIPRTSFDGSDGVLLDRNDGAFPIYVHRRTDGSFTAVLTQCTHQGCQVDPFPGRLVCPCHGSQYLPSGEVVEGPAERDLATFPVEVDGEDVRVDLGPGGPVPRGPVP